MLESDKKGRKTNVGTRSQRGANREAFRDQHHALTGRCIGPRRDPTVHPARAGKWAGTDRDPEPHPRVGYIKLWWKDKNRYVSVPYDLYEQYFVSATILPSVETQLTAAMVGMGHSASTARVARTEPLARP